MPVSQTLKIGKKVWVNAKFIFEVREMVRHLGERIIAAHAPIAKSEDFSFIVDDHITGYLSNRPHFLWVYRRDNPRGMLGEHEKNL